MPTQVTSLDTKRLEHAKNIIKEFGDKILPEIQSDILAQKVSIGMSPYEAGLAGGQYTFEVIADTSRWPTNADPYAVIQAQTLRPDDSHINLVFANTTQYPDRGWTAFRVLVRHGRVQEINRLDVVEKLK